jgi:hypothetical protein
MITDFLIRNRSKKLIDLSQKTYRFISRNLHEKDSIIISHVKLQIHRHLCHKKQELESQRFPKTFEEKEKMTHITPYFLTGFAPFQ